MEGRDRRHGLPFRLRPDGSFEVTEAFPYSDVRGSICPTCKYPGGRPIYHRDRGITVVMQCSNRACSGKGAWTICTICVFACPRGGVMNTTERKCVKTHFSKECHANGLIICRTYLARSIELQRQEQNKKRAADRDRELNLDLQQYFGATLLKEYLAHEMVHGVSGTQPLVMNGCFPQDYCKRKDKVPQEDVAWEFLASYNYFRFSKPTRQCVVALVNHYYERGRRHEAEDHARSQGLHVTDARRIKPPVDLNELNRRYLLSKYSVTRNLPIPIVVKKALCHACTSVKGCVKDFLAHGTPFEAIPNRPNPAELGEAYAWITETPRSGEIRTMTFHNPNCPDSTPVVVLPLIVWRDDFQGNNSTKQKGSTWMQTLTVSPHRGWRDLLQQTYPNAISESSCASHSPAEVYLHRHLEKMMTKPTVLFSAKYGGPVTVFAVPFAFIGDQPERRKTTRMMNGNSTYHARFRWSINHKALLGVLRTCSACTMAMREGSLRSGCKECAVWDPEAALATGCPILLEKLKLKLPKDYPLFGFGEGELLRDNYITQDNKILPFQLTSLRAKRSLRLAYTNLLSKTWSNKNTETFLERECFLTELISNVLSYAANERALKEVTEKRSTQSQRLQDLVLEDAKKHPSQYREPAQPFSWNILPSKEDSLSLFVDVLMHLLFLGIVKTTLQSVKDWTKLQQLFNDFRGHAAKYDALLDEVHLDWLRFRFYKLGTFGGWVSENFVAFSRILPWFFQDIPNLVSIGENDVPPTDRPNTTWKKKHYVYWLKRRGQKYKGTLQELKTIVLGLLDRPGGPPPVPVTVAGKFTPSQVERVLVSLEDMVAVIMTPVVIPGKTEGEMEYRIKHFLTEFDLLDQELKTEHSIPKVFASWNFVCLLNLPKLTTRFGPLRNLWEGGNKGEGFIQHCKQFLRGGQRKNFETTAMKKCLQETAYKRAADKVQGRSPRKIPTSFVEFVSQQNDSYKTYSSRNDASSRLFAGKVLSVMVCSAPRNDKSWARLVFVIGKSTNLLGDFPGRRVLYEMKCMQQSGVQRMGRMYCTWTIEYEPMSLGHIETSTGPFKFVKTTFGLLLPLVNDDGEGSPKHDLVVRSRFSLDT